MKPFIGANVMYVLATGPNSGTARLGFITRVLDNGKVSITCLPDPAFDGIGQIYSSVNVDFDSNGADGTWRWPSAAKSSEPLPAWATLTETRETLRL